MEGMPVHSAFIKLFLLGTLMALAGCGVGPGSSEKKYVAPTAPTVPASDGSSDPGVGTTPVDSLGFYITLNDPSDTIDEILHTSAEAYGTNTYTTTNLSDTGCIIDSGTAAGTGDKFCIMEVEELDLFFNPIVLKYHVPSDMCSYFEVRMPYFFAYEPGNGPTQASHEVFGDGSMRDVLNTSSGVATCSDYNYNYLGQGGPNCCVGEYSHLVTTYVSDSTGSFTQNTTSGTWDGDISNCIEGPAKELNYISTVSGRHLAQISYVENSGKVGSVTVPAAKVSSSTTGILYKSNLMAANFYNLSDHGNAKPRPLQLQSAVTELYHDEVPQDTYEFLCLDRAWDVNHRIRLMIREWNTTPISEGGDPDVRGAETGFTDKDLNDASDWKDIQEVGDYPQASL